MGATTLVRETVNGKLGEKGQVVIPAEFRHALGLKAGDALMLIFDGSSVRVMTRKALVNELHGVFAVPGSPDMTEELLQDRRDEAAKKWL